MYASQSVCEGTLSPFNNNTTLVVEHTYAEQQSTSGPALVPSKAGLQYIFGSVAKKPQFISQS